MSPPLKVAIVGAGPAGTMLARLLQTSPTANKDTPQISVKIFEGESSANFRAQGGTLDLHVKTGQAALAAGGLLETFMANARYDGEAAKFADKKLLCYVKMSGPAKPKEGSARKKAPSGRPEIDRPVLRRMLFESLQEGTVVWGKKVARIEDRGGEQREKILHFADGTSTGKGEGFDVVVGADGAWSRVRPLLSDVKPHFSGVGGYSFAIDDAERRTPELYELVNRGSLFAFDEGKTIIAQQMGDGSLVINCWVTVSPELHKPAGHDRDAATMKAEMVQAFEGWDSRLVDFIRKADDHVVPRDLYMLPVGFKWQHVPGVTLIGDAAHLMTPFAGEGVNLALADSLKLSQHLLKAAADGDPHAALDAQLLAFEQDMFTRAAKVQQLTFDLMTYMLFTPGSPRSCIERYMLRAVADEIGWVGAWLLTPVVYAWFAVFRLIW